MESPWEWSLTWVEKSRMTQILFTSELLLPLLLRMPVRSWVQTQRSWGGRVLEHSIDLHHCRHWMGQGWLSNSQRTILGPENVPKNVRWHENTGLGKELTAFTNTTIIFIFFSPTPRWMANPINEVWYCVLLFSNLSHKYSWLWKLIIALKYNLLSTISSFFRPPQIYSFFWFDWTNEWMNE